MTYIELNKLAPSEQGIFLDKLLDKLQGSWYAKELEFNRWYSWLKEPDYNLFSI